MIDARAPFVLLDDAREGEAAPARLYRDPLEIVTATALDEVAPALGRLADGRWAGFISYEAGHALEPRLAPLSRDPGLPLLWFGRFDGYRELAPDEIVAMLPPAEGGWAAAPEPLVTRTAYGDAVARVKEAIVAGDIYQANLSFRADVAAAGHPLALYAGLRERARAGYGGVIWTGRDWLLSLSPELFFALKDGKITTRPMKGTAPRILPELARGGGPLAQRAVEGNGAIPLHHPSDGPPPRGNLGEDLNAIETLRADPKQRAENLMIVDLLRNDLSRVAEAGSVDVPHLFTVETYPTIHTMTSTVTARLRAGLGAVDALTSIFPCGSITGAPKMRATEIIGDVEPDPRGIYTGSIGRIDPSGDAAFNVAIRTLHIRAGESVATLGLGSGIVADSRAEDEWEECLAKGRFVADTRQFDLIETMRFDPAGGIHLLDRHVARIGESARVFGIPFDRHAVRNALQGATFRIASPSRVRLMLSQSARIAIEIAPLPPTPAEPVEVALAPLPVAADDFRLAHKTSDRAFYDDPRRESGAFETVFTDPHGFLTEGSFTNVFVKGEGALLTPPLARGLLPGILRAELLTNGSAVEADLTAADLANGFFIGNALRGLIEARLQSSVATEPHEQGRHR